MVTDRRVVVTGASGLIGMPLALALAPHNEVVAAARFRLEADRTALEAAGVRTVSLDLAEPDLSVLPARADVVFHFGGMTAFPRDADERALQFAVNTHAAGLVAARYRDAEAFVHASSGSVYAFAGTRPLRESDAYGLHIGNYSATKIAAEHLLRFLSETNGTPMVLLRIFSAFGPRGGSLVARVRNAIAGRPVNVWPGLPNVCAPIYEPDYVAKAIAAAAHASAPPLVVNFGGSHPTTVEAYCRYAAGLVRREPVFHETEQALYPTLPDTSLMEELLGPTAVTPEEAVEDLVRRGFGGVLPHWDTWSEPAR